MAAELTAIKLQYSCGANGKYNFDDDDLENVKTTLKNQDVISVNFHYTKCSKPLFYCKVLKDESTLGLTKVFTFHMPSDSLKASQQSRTLVQDALEKELNGREFVAVKDDLYEGSLLNFGYYRCSIGSELSKHVDANKFLTKTL